jgi:hypothetical protein
MEVFKRSQAQWQPGRFGEGSLVILVNLRALSRSNNRFFVVRLIEGHRVITRWSSLWSSPVVGVLQKSLLFEGGHRVPRADNMTYHMRTFDELMTLIKLLM